MDITDARPEGGVMGADALPEIWEGLEEVKSAGEVTTSQLNGQGQTVWDVDGEGTGGYWMRKDWAGSVEGMTSWERLFNVTAR